MATATANPEGIRVLRKPLQAGGSGLLLQQRERMWDLSATLHARGHAVGGLAELLVEGFFERDRLLRDLERADWVRLGDGEQYLSGLETPLSSHEVGKVLALGKNFRAHAEEFGEEVPEEPLFFNKLPEGLVPHDALVAPPEGYEGRFDHEAELAVVIGREGKAIPESRAFEHVAGYAVANDLTLRSLQGHDRKAGHPWFRAKNFDGACPFGPCLVPRDFLDLGDLRVSARVDDEVRQEATTRDLVVTLPHALATLSRHLTLRVGDLVLMGTPAGVGPLENGQRVVCEVEGIGLLATRIVR